MTINMEADRIVITVQTRSELDSALNKAQELLRPAALIQGAGITVTRLAPGRFEARLSTEVSPGTTMEIWAANIR